ncbi:MAG: PA0069 family radical SAM protein [Beijerinckiaceae bacterium]
MKNRSGPRLRGRLPQASDLVPEDQRRGRGTMTNETSRFEPRTRHAYADGWDLEEELPPLKTQVTVERARTIITKNDSPDIAFDRSINPYRGCEHGCVYCFARPTHAYLGLSPGLDFESKLFMKPDAAQLLARELDAPGYKPQTIAMGTNTDPYQPIEKTHRITRQVLEVLQRANHPVAIVTKSTLVTRDIDLLAAMAQKGLAKVALSVTTLDPHLARIMEPRAATPGKRLETIRTLKAAGIPVSVLVAPIIPAINDPDIERILDAARAAGADDAGYVLLRLPLELTDLFREWLLEHYPDRLRHVMSLIRQTRGGKDYQSEWGVRQSGTGPYAWLIGRRFELAATRLGFGKRRIKMRTDLFMPPGGRGRQMELF